MALIAKNTISLIFEYVSPDEIDTGNIVAIRREPHYFKTNTERVTDTNLKNVEEVLLWCNETFGPEKENSNSWHYQYMVWRTTEDKLKGNVWETVAVKNHIFVLTVVTSNDSDAAAFKLRWL